MNTHDIEIELPAEFRSGNGITVTQATIKLERMQEILRAAIEADRQQRHLKEESQIEREWVHLRAMQAQYEADRKRRGEPTAAEISDVIREITGCPDIKNGEDSLVVALGMLFHRGATTQSAEPVNLCDCGRGHNGMGMAGRECDCPDNNPQPAEPVKRKRRYAQGTALGEFGVIPMCDQVDDEPVVANAPVPSDDVLADALYNLEHDNYEQSYSGYKNRQADLGLIRALLTRYGQPAP